MSRTVESASSNFAAAHLSGNGARMQVAAAMLADAVQVCDEMLFILDGGFGPLHLRQFPAPFARRWCSCSSSTRARQAGTSSWA